MVQKSILSFFKAQPSKNADEASTDTHSQEKSMSVGKNAVPRTSSMTSASPNVSPVKVRRRKRVCQIESDSEEETAGEPGMETVEENEVQGKEEIVPEENEAEEKEEKVPAQKNGTRKGFRAKLNKFRREEGVTEEERQHTELGCSEKIANEDQNISNGSEKRNSPDVLEEADTEAKESGSSLDIADKESSHNFPSTSFRLKASVLKCPGFTKDTVPPLRKTARKQMKRKSDSLEEKQMEHVKKVKSGLEDSENMDETSGNETAANEPLAHSAKETTSCTSEVSLSAAAKDDENTNENKDDDDVSYDTPAVSVPASDKEVPRKSLQKTVHPFFSLKSPKATNDESSPKQNKYASPPKSSRKKENGDVKQENETVNQQVKCSEAQAKLAGLEKAEGTKSANTKSETAESSDAILSDGTTDTINRKEKKTANSKMTSVVKDGDKVSEKNDSSSASTSFSSSTKSSSNLFTSSYKDSSDLGARFDPSRKKYHPINDAFWQRNDKVPYLALAKTFMYIEETSGRLKIIEILANFFRSVIILMPEDLLPCVYLCLNKVAPAFEGVELNVGEGILTKVIAQATGRSVEKIKSDIDEKGDLGLVAEQSKSNQRMMFQPPKLTVQGVFKKLKEIAMITGHASQAKKVDTIKSIFVACRECEARYFIRSLTGKLRIGLAEQSVLQAIAQSCFQTPPNQPYPPAVLDASKGLSVENFKAKVEEYALIVKTTYSECPTYNEIIPVLLKHGISDLPKYCKLTPGIPLKPMLAYPTKGVSEVLKRFQDAEFTCEFKYDGERAQIHLKEDGTVKIFSRNQEDNTSKYPDIISRLPKFLGENVKCCIIDSESVAYDPEGKQILPFQILSTRKRKDADEKEIKVQVCVFPFDLLYFNGQNLVKEPLRTRRKYLRENFTEIEGEFVFAKSMDSTNTEDIEEFLEESIKGKCEGLMVKTFDVDATYEIAKRSHNWLKLKKDYLEGVGDTIDVVVIGGYLGRGKRAGFYGGFLLACYDPDNEEFQTICKIGTGFTDEDLQKHSEFFKDHIIDTPKSYFRYDPNVTPDHWFEAVQVWEIKCADLSISPVHKAAVGTIDREKGISLRFPRFLRIRDDKTPEEATPAAQIAELYKSQEQVKNQAEGNRDNSEDFY